MWKQNKLSFYVEDNNFVDPNAKSIGYQLFFQFPSLTEYYMSFLLDACHMAEAVKNMDKM